MNNIEVGTILKVYCPNKLVWHFGIMSHFGMVIDRAKRGVQLRTWEEFSENLEVKIVPTDSTDFPKKVIHERAMGLVGQRGYHIIFQNCEHFVSWCRKNKVVSHQLIYATLIIVIIGIISAFLLTNKRKSFA